MALKILMRDRMYFETNIIEFISKSLDVVWNSILISSGVCIGVIVMATLFNLNDDTFI